MSRALPGQARWGVGRQYQQQPACQREDIINKLSLVQAVAIGSRSALLLPGPTRLLLVTQLHLNARPLAPEQT